LPVIRTDDGADDCANAGGNDDQRRRRSEPQATPASRRDRGGGDRAVERLLGRRPDEPGHTFDLRGKRAAFGASRQMTPEQQPFELGQLSIKA
jgi:hypothetical protein